MINNPALMLADEPTGNLDSKASDEIISLLKLSNKKFNQTVVIITHDLEIAKEAERVITIEDGLLRSGLSTTVNELIVNNNITNVKVRNFGYDDKYVKQGSISEIEKINGLDVESIVDAWNDTRKSIINGVTNG